MSIAKKKIEKSLSKKGFEIVVNKDHRYFHFEYNGKRIGIFTCVSHGGDKDISDSLISRMRKQLKLDKIKQAYDLFRCPMKYSDYIEILKEKKSIK